ncbi:MAG: hypothetical protein COV48_14510, partial [Elusimicrobia bacterium CG11_big_fil_rev_8_21_14_0_20_64_6]
MKIGVVYSMEGYSSLTKPMASFIKVPFGLSFVATVLKKIGHDVELLVVTEDSDLDAVLREFITSFKPAMFCFTAVTTQFPLIKQAARAVKEIDSAIYTVIGGAYPILDPETIIASRLFDAVCTGEGEEAIVQLAD